MTQVSAQQKGANLGHLPTSRELERKRPVSALILRSLPELIDIVDMETALAANPRRKATRREMFMALSFGLLPYLGGLLVIWTRQVGWLALEGALICVVSTSGAYILRKSADSETAKQRLIIDPMLYGFEFAFTAVLIRYVFLR